MKNIFTILHHKIIYDERDSWMNEMLILASGVGTGGGQRGGCPP